MHNGEKEEEGIDIIMFIYWLFFHIYILSTDPMAA